MALEKYKECETEAVNRKKKRKKRRKKTGYIIDILIILILMALLALVLWVGYSLYKEGIINIPGIGYRNKVITAENCEELMNKANEKMKEDDELYYMSYSTLYYIMQDGLSGALVGNTDESAMYRRIYGKTINQLIDEGKQLMKDNNITIEEYKQQLETLKNTNDNIIMLE